MTYSLNWLTKVVTIPKADLTLVQASPEIRALDVTAFWAAIHLIQAGEGISYPDIMRSNAPVTLAGQTYARSVEVINGYTIEFENGAYQVNLTGANNNLLNARVQNQVSLNASNSAGAVVVTSGSGLSTPQAVQLAEMWRRFGLDPTRPLVSTASSINVGPEIAIALTGDGVTTSTATRQS